MILTPTLNRYLSFTFALALFLFPTISNADVTGLWVCDFNLNGSGSYPQDMNLIDSGGTVTGQEYATGTTTPFANITGTSSGNSFSIVAQYISINYYANINGTVNGNSMSGMWFNASQIGGFTCTKSSSISPTPVPTGTPSASSKRPTAITLFCNRTGVNLSTAVCSVTVAAAGAPPRSAPTGDVDFVSKNGFFPSNASCSLLQTPFSPGIVSCQAEFAVPFGFPIGIAFPIDATYDGDSVFNGSSTSHATIQAGCVGDAANPCSGAVALTFSDLPQVLKNALATVFECGSNKSVPQKASAAIISYGLLPSNCLGDLSANSKLGEILAAMDIGQIETLAGSISGRDALNDALLKAFRAIDDFQYRTQLQESINQADKLTDLFNKILKDQSKQPALLGGSGRPETSAARFKKISVVSFGTTSFKVKENSRKTIKVLLNSTAAKLVKALKKAGVGDIPITISMKGKRQSGPKHPFKRSFTVTAGLR